MAECLSRNGGALKTSASQIGFSPHVLTLTPFYPSESDEGNGCFVYEPLVWLSRLGVRNIVMCVQPMYRRKPSIYKSDFPAEWMRYFSLPSGFGLSTGKSEPFGM